MEMHAHVTTVGSDSPKLYDTGGAIAIIYVVGKWAKWPTGNNLGGGA